MERPDQTTPPSSEPVAPEAPTVPYWPVSTELDADFDRQHYPYLESP
jgi:hypothetical protein